MVRVRVRVRFWARVLVRVRHKRTIQNVENLSARTDFAAISGPRGLFLAGDHIFRDSALFSLHAEYY